MHVSHVVLLLHMLVMALYCHACMLVMTRWCSIPQDLHPGTILVPCMLVMTPYCHAGPAPLQHPGAMHVSHDPLLPCRTCTLATSWCHAC